MLLNSYYCTIIYSCLIQGYDEYSSLFLYYINFVFVKKITDQKYKPYILMFIDLILKIHLQFYSRMKEEV